MMGAVLNQAAAPFGLLAMQNMYGKRRTRKMRGSRKFRRGKQ